MRLLVALDGSDKDAAVVAYAATLARAASTDVVLVHAVNAWVDPPEATEPFLTERLAQVWEWRRAYLQEQATAFAGLPVQVRVEWRRWPPKGRAEEIADCIARVASECAADLLLVASKRVSNFTGLLLGSTAQALLRHSPCPVLVVRPPGATIHRAPLVLRSTPAPVRADRDMAPAGHSTTASTGRTRHASPAPTAELAPPVPAAAHLEIVDGVRGPDDLDPIFIPERLRDGAA